MEKELDWDPVQTVLDFLTEHTPVENIPVTDGIFVFGHYQPLVAYHGAALWKEKKSEKIIIVGDKGSYPIPPQFVTKADFYASLMKAAGVPEDALILEKKSGNVLENVVFGIKTCHTFNLFPKTLVLCALPPLLRRCEATFQKQFPDIIVYKSAFSMPTEWFVDVRIRRLLGELERLREYAKKGDIADVEIPEKVLLAEKEIEKALAP